MKKIAGITVVVVLGLTVATFIAKDALQAQGQFGTPAEAKAMLQKAVAAVKANKEQAITTFNKGEGGFKDRDLYPFCFNIADGKILATQASRLIGTDLRALKDNTGKAFGEEMYKTVKAGKEGTVAEVSYMFPRPGETTPVQKVSFVTKVGDLGVGVGYYK